VPTWLDEGLAAALEAADLSWAERRLQQAPAAVRLAELPNGFGQLAATDAQLAYAASAVVVRRLIQEAGGFAIANLLRDIGDGVDFSSAFLHRIQRPVGDLRAADIRRF
jgi:hypothetical protein